jgi:hypothetical protein
MNDTKYIKKEPTNKQKLKIYYDSLEIDRLKEPWKQIKPEKLRTIISSQQLTKLGLKTDQAIPNIANNST